jgi:hypothetical protein
VCQAIAACTRKPVLRMPKAIEFDAPQGMGIETGVDLDKLIETGWWLAQQLGKPTSSRVTRARMGE